MGCFRREEHDQAQGARRFCAPEVSVTAVTKRFKDVTEIYGPPTPFLGVDPRTGV